MCVYPFRSSNLTEGLSVIFLIIDRYKKIYEKKRTIVGQQASFYIVSSNRLFMISI